MALLCALSCHVERERPHPCGQTREPPALVRGVRARTGWGPVRVSHGGGHRAGQSSTSASGAIANGSCPSLPKHDTLCTGFGTIYFDSFLSGCCSPTPHSTTNPGDTHEEQGPPP